MGDGDECEPSEDVEAVEAELREPLLVDPVRAVAPDRERLVMRDPVPGDLPAGNEREPAVGVDLAHQPQDERAREDRERRDDEPVSP